MGLFKNKRPKLPSYVGASLEQLLQDPEWAYAVGQAGIDPNTCEIVMLLAEATIGQGRSGGVPTNATPVILFGSGDTVAMAFPDGREVKVVSRPSSRAELQTQRSGWFQILFGPAENLDGFMFWGSTDNLTEGTPEGDMFGQVLSAFLKGKLRPQQIVGTPQSLVASNVADEVQAPALNDPEDALRWKMFKMLSESLSAMMELNTACHEKVERAEGAIAMGNAEFVDGVRQHELSREAFRDLGVSLDSEATEYLQELRGITAVARAQWRDLIYLLPGSDSDVEKIAAWCTTVGVDSALHSAVVSRGMLIHADYGVTRESYWAENSRIAAIFEGMGY